jgi:hypothetical protein
MSSSKKFTCKWTLRQVFFCLRPRTPYPPPLTCCIRVFTQGRGKGGQLNQREGKRGNCSQSWVENINILQISIKTCRKVSSQVNFLDDYILLWCLLVS